MIRNFILFTCLLLGIVHAKSQCVINGLNLVPSECNFNGEFYVKISFDHSGTTNQFSVQGNGKNYGKFEYSKLPVTLGPFAADCTTSYEFVVRDVVNTACTNFKEFGKKCCTDKCSIAFTDVKVDSCNADGITYGLKFNLSRKVIESSKSFIFYNNGVLVDTFEYMQLPLQLKSLKAAFAETFNSIVVCDITNPHCCDTLKVFNPCTCSIYDIRSQVVDCNEDNENFDIRFDFKYNMVSDSFVIGGNNMTYGTFAYKDLPIKLSNLPFSNTKFYEFLIIDKGDVFCFGSYELGIVNTCRFECKIDGLGVHKGECVGDSIYLKLNFDYANTSLEGFSIRGNGVVYGEYQYGEGPYILGPFKQDCGKKLEFVVVDKSISGCMKATLFSEPLCCNCHNSELFVTEVCEGDKLVAFNINFGHSNTSAFFNLLINGVNRGKYSYSDLPIKITNLDGIAGQHVVIKIIDSENELCNLIKEHTFNCNLHGDCRIYDLVSLAGACNDAGIFYARIKFKTAFKGNHGFLIKVNGIIFDTLEYGKEVYEIGPLLGDCSTLYKFLIQDIAKPDCRADVSFTEVVCCGNEDCKIYDLVVTKSACNEAGKFIAIVKFKTQNVGNHGFFVKVNGIIKDTFEYGHTAYEIGPLDGDCSTIYKFLIQDVTNTDCRDDYSFLEPVCCGDGDCKLSAPIIAFTPCIDGTYNLVLKFTHSNTTTKFKVKANGQVYGPFSYIDLPVTITGLKSNTSYEVLIADGEMSNCQIAFLIPAIDCLSATDNSGNPNFEASIIDQVLYLNDVNSMSSKVAIYDITGKIWLGTKSIAKQEIDIISWPTGVYVIVWLTSKGKIIKKVVKL
jgi:hypothetical protein